MDERTMPQGIRMGGARLLDCYNLFWTVCLFSLREVPLCLQVPQSLVGRNPRKYPRA